MAWFLFEARRYSESIEAAKTFAEEDDPIVAMSYLELGRREEALAAADRAAQRTEDLIALAHAATVYALTGKTQKARGLFNQILQGAQQHYICGFNMACVYAALGDKEGAFEWLDKAYLSRSD
jgi:tetratricopeptide (TPR) repeat protein